MQIRFHDLLSDADVERFEKEKGCTVLVHSTLNEKSTLTVSGGNEELATFIKHSTKIDR